MQIKNTIVGGSPLFVKPSGADGEGVKICGAKRPIPSNCNSPQQQQQQQQQCSTSNPGSGHLVYVRRKMDNQSDGAGPQAQLSKSPGAGTNQEEEARNCVTKPSISSSSSSVHRKRSIDNITSTNNTLLADPKAKAKRVDVNYFHDRYSKLQSFLEEMEQSSQSDYIQMLRSLSSVELSRHAVELEKRSIQLSLEEGKELQRVRVLDVLGRYSTQHV